MSWSQKHSQWTINHLQYAWLYSQVMTLRHETCSWVLWRGVSSSDLFCVNRDIRMATGLMTMIYTKIGKSNLLTFSFVTFVELLSMMVVLIYWFIVPLKSWMKNYHVFFFPVFWSPIKLSNTVKPLSEIMEKTSFLDFIPWAVIPMEIYLVLTQSCQWLGVMEGTGREGKDRPLKESSNAFR